MANTKKNKKKRNVLLIVVGLLVVGFLLFMFISGKNKNDTDVNHVSVPEGSDAEEDEGFQQGQASLAPVFSTPIIARNPLLDAVYPPQIPVVYPEDHLIRQQFEKGQYPSDVCRHKVMTERNRIDFLYYTRSEEEKKEMLYRYFRDQCYPGWKPDVSDGNI